MNQTNKNAVHIITQATQALAFKKNICKNLGNNV